MISRPDDEIIELCVGGNVHQADLETVLIKNDITVSCLLDRNVSYDTNFITLYQR